MAADVIVCKSSHRIIPHYAKEDITELADQNTWSPDDIYKLYLQTGLGECALLTMKSQHPYYENDRLVPLSERLKPFQEALFYEGDTEHELVADVSKRDLMKGFSAPIAPVMEAGDVFVNSSTHTLGFRNGHASLLLDSFGTVLESLELGADSAISTSGDQWFAESSNFILLRLKDVDKATREAIAQEAANTLKGIPYDLTVGIFSKKYQGARPKSTHCSHLVWQAYKNAGYEIDSNGGIIVTPRDIARCNLFEVVQVYGFDPEELW